MPQKCMWCPDKGDAPALLLDDGTLLTEGAAIVQYIADQVPSKRLAPPNGTIERAKLQAWLNFFSSEMHKGAFGPIFHKGLSEESKEVFRDRLRTRYTHLDRHLADHEYLMGKDFTIADAMFAPVVHRFRTYAIAVSPKAQAYMETMMGLPAFAEWTEAGLAETLVIERLEAI